MRSWIGAALPLRLAPDPPPLRSRAGGGLRWRQSLTALPPFLGAFITVATKKAWGFLSNGLLFISETVGFSHGYGFHFRRSPR
jgi:hypothetical protein